MNARPPPPVAPSSASKPRVGSCTLVGAGPGDPELLTLKAVKAVSAATVVLVDDLVSDAVLQFVVETAPPCVRIVHVGKRGGCASTPQAFIERLMASEALAGEHVVRLKGGDPMIFGRGGEEIEHLRALGVPCTVVNGITAGLAAATALHVSLTHRHHAQGVLFVTGHPRGAAAPLDWPAIGATAALGVTLVIYMGVATVATIQEGLMQTMPAATPVAVLQNVSLPEQRAICGTLSELAALLEREHLGSPAVILIGDILQGERSVRSSLPSLSQAA